MGGGRREGEEEEREGGGWERGEGEKGGRERDRELVIAYRYSLVTIFFSNLEQCNAVPSEHQETPTVSYTTFMSAAYSMCTTTSISYILTHSRVSKQITEGG